MSIPARQSTALEIAIGPVLDADGVAVTDCVVADFKLKKTTGNFAALNGSATLTHVSAGMYDLVLTASDTDTVGSCCVAIDDTVNACAPVRLQVVEEAVYDALYAASATGPLTTLGTNAPAGWINEAAFANDAITDAKVASDVTIASVTGNVGGNVAGSVGSVAGDIGGNLTGTIGGLSTQAKADVNAEADAALSDVGVTTTVTGRIDAAISTRLASASYTAPPTASDIATAVWSAGTRTLTSFGTLVADIWASASRTLTAFTGFQINSDVTAIKAKTDNLPASPAATSDIPSADIIADAVWDEAASGHSTAGSFGKATSDILVDTAEIGLAGAGLTEAGGTGDQFTGIASVGAVVGAVGSVTGTVGGVAGTTTTLDALATLIRGADNDTLKTISDQIDSIPTTIRVKKNAALAGFPIIMIDTSGDPATGKTVAGTVSIDGAAFTSLTNAISEVSGGLYKVDLAAGDTNGDTLVMRFTATGCRTRFVEIVTQP